MIDWLTTPLSGVEPYALATWTVWHARLMVLSWTIMLPLGMLIARFWKVTPRQDWPNVLDRKHWWQTHLWLQSAGVVVMSLGLMLAYGQGAAAVPAARIHHFLGWMIVCIGWAQVTTALFRGSKGGPSALTLRGDHYDMTRRRILFEVFHKSMGWLSIPLVVTTTGLGLSIVDAPRWMPIVLAAWWLVLIAAFIHLQRTGRCIDTYQAIWGHDVAHPGNSRKAIGWGIVRHPSSSSERSP